VAQDKRSPERTRTPAKRHLSLLSMEFEIIMGILYDMHGYDAGPEGTK
jgi:hypothetical protein